MGRVHHNSDPTPCMVMHSNLSQPGHIVFGQGLSQWEQRGPLEIGPPGEQPRRKWHLFQKNKGQILKGTILR